MGRHRVERRTSIRGENGNMPGLPQKVRHDARHQRLILNDQDLSHG